MKRFVLAVVAAAALSGIAGCGGASAPSAANETACAEALQEVLSGDAPLAKPAACRGISEDRMGELSFHGSPEAADEAAAEDE